MTESEHQKNSTPDPAHDAAPTHGHIRSYVLRQGRLSAAQARALEAQRALTLPYIAAPLDTTTVFGRQAPVIVEIGFGMGHTTADIAALRPEDDFIGIEVHTPGVGSLLKMVGERQLQNLRVVQHDAVDVMTQMIADASLAGIHVFFPDPWHKKRHHKRRLIQSPFVALLVSKLRAGGYLHLATDWQDYAEQMLATLAANPDLINTAEGFAPRPQYRTESNFERRGLRLGHGVWDVVFMKK
jgi:tRNA (guanine-N7-)-methyltransferase